MKVGYIVKRYPRFSETFIVNEILAHEAAGVALDSVTLIDHRKPLGVSREGLWSRRRRTAGRT